MLRLLWFLVCLPLLTRAQARQTIRHLKQIRFQEPVEVLVRLDNPVPGAEHRMIMEEALVPFLDTLSFRGLLNHPGIYFAKIYTNSVPGLPRRKYYLTTPETPGGLDPLKPIKFPYEKLERPPRGRFYTRIEPAKSYKMWSKAGYNGEGNTLPGVDSVRAVYIIKVRPRWQRDVKGKAVK